ncbi:hypothetical protein ACFX5U_12450 [Sphingobacterium sp. SG20118]|uniref:hypothetical protein n=1 Tax=Sphingobacterium sp. SG20118 TaxID=3367156 RepID=UPI0037DFC817
MQNTCYLDSYALTLREEMSSYRSEKEIPIVKKPIMINLLPERFFKQESIDSAQEAPPKALQYVKEERPAQPYYSLLIRLLEPSDAYSMVVRNDRTDVLRISLINMSIYEIYLFALGLPAEFPTNQVLVLGEERKHFISDDPFGILPTYAYELAVPAKTEREEYRQRILNDMNKHFQLEVRVEKLSIVKGSRKVLTISGESVELIWDEQLMMIVKANKVVSS